MKKGRCCLYLCIGLLASSCLSRQYNQASEGVDISKTESIQDEHYLLGMVADPEKEGAFQFRLCDVIEKKVFFKDAVKDCRNPLLDKDNKPFSFVMIPSTQIKNHLALKGYGKVALVVVGGAAAILYGWYEAKTLGRDLDIAFTYLQGPEVGALQKWNVIAGFWIGVAGKAVAMYYGGAWGNGEREFSKHFDQLFTKDDMDKPVAVNNVLDIVQATAEALGAQPIPGLIKPWWKNIF